MASILKFVTAGLLAATAAAHPLHGHGHSGHQVRPSTLQKRSGTSTKRGAAYNEATLVSALTSSSSVVSWAYNWGSTIDGDLPSGVEYVPMLWGIDDVDTWAAAVSTALADGSTHLMGFNEPDSSSQADISYSDAATYYKEYLTAYSSDFTLVSPAVTSSTTTGEGLSWLASFLEECTSCDISAIAVHWYGGDISEFKTFVTEAISTASTYSISEVWVTEFGLDTDESAITDLATAATFVTEASTWLEEQSEVARYSFFYCANDFMLTDSVANTVGDAYLAVSGSSTTSSSTTTSSESASTTTYVASSASTYVSVSTETISSSETEVSSSVSVSIEIGADSESEATTSTSVSTFTTSASTSTVVPTSTPEPTTTYTSTTTIVATATAVATTSVTTSSAVTSSPVASSTPTPTSTPVVTPSATPSTSSSSVATAEATVAAVSEEATTPFDYGACGAPRPASS
ncbi:hypothetical protein N7466_008286 [Penicillium verhagenii]|uniref:uncharacterized protein n=1 Tax=Penicillium verhagenii TaxID=1562060 RepID=UPI0025450F41|nr:uncharacterized protein N7466_008286 [Penicillium verhagenii]KAJ5924099.1 hypothetical protein N7466_008286 [Penicillium verhagenii]